MVSLFYVPLLESDWSACCSLSLLLSGALILHLLDPSETVERKATFQSAGLDGHIKWESLD